MGGGAALPVPAERAGEEAREAYSLRITPQSVEAGARSSAGLYYTAQTLRQMVEGAGEEAALPEAEERDWPSLAYRGYKMDMSHTHDLFRLEHLLCGVEIADFRNELRAHPDSKDALDMVQFEVTPKCHSRKSDMMDGVADIRDRFGEAAAHARRHAAA